MCPLKLSKVKGSSDLLDLIPFQSFLSLDSTHINTRLDTIFLHSQFAEKCVLTLFTGAFSRLLSEYISQSLKSSNIDLELTEESLSI